MDYFSSDFKLGILGGGQLGKMMLYETRKWDVWTKVLDSSLEAPCKIACNEFVQGDLLDYDTVYKFGKDVDVLTIEIENVNLDALEALEEEGIKVFPEPKALRIIQNKAKQKLFYVDNGIPTADFQRFAYVSEIEDSINNGGLELPFVWKKAQFGYDGQGVKVVRKIEDLEGLPSGECIAEKMIPFKNELAVIAQNIGLTGLLAVEMFQTQDDKILVNEVAPRPHNSGHYSIEASYTNQFEQHIRCILGLPLGKTESKVAGIMVNLVGAEGHTGDVVYENMTDILQMDGVTPHIYGKKQTRPFRKMGHVTIVDEDITKARKIAQEVKETIKVISK